MEYTLRHPEIHPVNDHVWLLNDEYNCACYGVAGADKAMVIERFRETAPNQKVWYYVNSHADIHSYRADYSTRVYKLYARDIKDIPYDRINKGLGYKYQSGVYRCKGDEKGKVLDRAAMVKTTRALGHTRIDVIAGHYLRAL